MKIGILSLLSVGVLGLWSGAANAGFLAGSVLIPANPGDHAFISGNGTNVYNNDTATSHVVRGSLHRVKVTTTQGVITVYTTNNGLTQTCTASFRNVTTGSVSSGSTSVSGTGYFSYQILVSSGTGVFDVSVACSIPPHVGSNYSYIYGIGASGDGSQGMTGSAFIASSPSDVAFVSMDANQDVYNADTAATRFVRAGFAMRTVNSGTLSWTVRGTNNGLLQSCTVYLRGPMTQAIYQGSNSTTANGAFSYNVSVSVSTLGTYDISLSCSIPKMNNGVASVLSRVDGP